VSNSETVVFVNGIFDIFHYGHLYFLWKAKYFGDRLIIGINSDSSAERIKRKPIFNWNARSTVLGYLNFVSRVYAFSEDTPYELIKKIKPDVICKGEDWAEEDIVGRDLVKKIVRIPLYKPEVYSTTAIIERMINEKST